MIIFYHKCFPVIITNIINFNSINFYNHLINIIKKDYNGFLKL